MARPWSARCYGGSSPTRWVAPKQHRVSGRVLRLPHPYAREGADGQAVVCPLLRGSSPTRWVAPKQHRGPPRLPYLSTLTRARPPITLIPVVDVQEGAAIPTNV
jgi:hypothetical protein